MAELPTGTVTFLFSDIEGSTRLAHELGDRYADALEQHRRLLREAFDRHDGVEVGTEGDSFFVAFARARDALAAAADGSALSPPTAGRAISRSASASACTPARRSSLARTTSGSTSTAPPG